MSDRSVVEHTVIVQQYSDLMQELVERSVALELLCSGAITLSPALDLELAVLQVRLISEILALACLTAHGEMEEVRTSAMQKEYRAEKIISRLDDLHPNFYPIPYSGEKQANNHLHIVPKTVNSLTKKQFHEYYIKSADFLHKGSIKKLIANKTGNFNLREIQEWNLQLQSLLMPQHHIRLKNDTGIVVCVFHNIKGKIKAQCAYAKNRSL